MAVKTKREFLTEEELDTLQSLLEKAAPGPWTHEADDEEPDTGIYASDGLVASVHPYANYRTIVSKGETFSRDDARFIAAANPHVIKRMIDEIRLLRARIDADETIEDLQ